MKESVAVAKEADRKQEFSPTKSDNDSIHRAQHEPERQIGYLGNVIGNIRRDGGAPSVEGIATELSGMHTAERAPVLSALQQTHGNRYVQRVIAQAKAAGQPGGVYGKEVADMARQRQCSTPECGEEEEMVQIRQTSEIPRLLSGVVLEKTSLRLQGEGEAWCDTATGTMQKRVTEHCAGDCVDQHETVHQNNNAECCANYNKCIDNGGVAACDTAWDNWFNDPGQLDWDECLAYTQEVTCLTAFIAANCDGRQSATTGATIGAIAGGILGGIAGFVVGGPVGAAVGAAGGAAVGAGVGHLVGRVSSACCTTLRGELTTATNRRDNHCAGAAQQPCPFDDDGNII